MKSVQESELKPIEEYRSVLKMLARRHIGTQWRRHLDDSDIVQTTMLEAYQCEEKFRGTTIEEQFAWLRQILANTVKDSVRRLKTAKRDVFREVDIDQAIRGSSIRIEQSFADPQSSPSQKAERREQFRQLASALMEIPESQRAAVELFYLDACSIEEVAEQLNRSTAAISGLICRGLHNLRLAMQNETSESNSAFLSRMKHDF